jgi:putative transposase
MFRLGLTLVATLRSALRTHQDLVLENLALRHQLELLTRTDRRPRFRPVDRLLWVGLRRCWGAWGDALVLVHPATVIRWHREGFRRYWRRRSQPRPGQPRLAAAVRALIREMARANPLWGAPRIHGELLTLGLDVSERTVSRYRPRAHRPPSQTWRTFLANHAHDLVSLDFFTVPTAMFQVLFVLVVVSHARRRIVHWNVTAHPTAAWTAQQIGEAFPWDTSPRFLLHDRDGLFVNAIVSRRVASLGITDRRTAPRAPWQNPYVERLIGSMRRECLDHIIVLNERHLRRVLVAYVRYYERARTHLSLHKDAPVTRPVQPPVMGRIVAHAHLGGLHHHDERRAA